MRLAVGALLTLALVAALGVLFTWLGRPPAAPPEVSSPPPALETPAGGGGRAASLLESTPEDPEALAAWFERQVRAELERTQGERFALATASRAGLAEERSSSRDGAGAPAAALQAETADPHEEAPLGLRARVRAAVEAAIEAGELGPVDWDYLDDVFAGRIHGIPNERKAGLDLEAIDALGEIPAVEELREAGATDALEDLGLEHPPGLPVCWMQGGQRFPVCSVDGA